MERIFGAEVVTSANAAGDKFDSEVFSEAVCGVVGISDVLLSSVVVVVREADVPGKASSAVAGILGVDVVISSVTVVGAEDTSLLRVAWVSGAGDVSVCAGAELGAGEEPVGATVECNASEQMTPTSSLSPQLCLPQPACRQSQRWDSLPPHCTSSSWIIFPLRP